MSDLEGKVLIGRPADIALRIEIFLLRLRPVLTAIGSNYCQKNDWELQELNAKKAFIQADLNFNVFLELSGGCGDKSGKVVKLSWEGARLSVIGKEVFFPHCRERLSSLLSADMELTQCLISRLLNRQTSALVRTKSRSVIIQFVRLLLVCFG